MDSLNFAYLFQRYTNNLCTEEETLAFMLMIEAAKHDDELKIMMDSLWQRLNVEQKLSRELQERILKEIFKASLRVVSIHSRLDAPTVRMEAVAFFIFFMVASFFIRFETGKKIITMGNPKYAESLFESFNQHLLQTRKFYTHQSI